MCSVPCPIVRSSKQKFVSKLINFKLFIIIDDEKFAAHWGFVLWGVCGVFMFCFVLVVLFVFVFFSFTKTQVCVGFFLKIVCG